MIRLVCLVLALVMVLSMTACGKDKKQEAKEYDGAALLQAILEQVKFSDTMTSVGEFASLYFPDLPESAKIEMYTGSGYYADELVLISVSDATDMEAVKASVDVHMEQLTAQFKNYIPEEVAKIEKAIADVKDAIQANDTERMKTTTEALTQAFYAVSEKMYQQTQQADPNAAQDPGQASGNDGGQEYYDADYKVVDED